MNNAQKEQYRKEMTETLKQYKQVKERSHNDACPIDSNEEAIKLLIAKNHTIDSMAKEGASNEEIINTAKEAYKKAGLFLGKE